MATMTIHTQEVNLRVIAIQTNPISSMDAEPFSTKLKASKPKLNIHGSTAAIEHVL